MPIRTPNKSHNQKMLWICCPRWPFPPVPADKHKDMTNWLSRTRSDDPAAAPQVSSIPVPKSPGTRHRTKPCPFCAETIRYEAIKCRFCGEFLTSDRLRDDPRSKSAASVANLLPSAAEQAALAGDNSDVLWFGRPSLLAMASTAFKTACFVAICWAVYRYQVTAVVARVPRSGVSAQQLMQIEGWIDLAALGLTIVALLVLAWKTAALKSIYYEVTPDRIEWSRGIFDRQLDNIDMFRVIDLKLRRSIIECLLGIGTVVLFTNDESDPQFEFVKVRQCRYLYDTLKEAGLKADKKRNVIHVE